MVRQEFNIADYWTVIVYYDVDYRYFGRIVRDMNKTDASTGTIKEAYDMLKYGGAKAATFAQAKRGLY